MLLLKDYQTQKKSLTVTCFIITFLFAFVSGLILLARVYKGVLRAEDIFFGFYSLSFLGIFVSLYWNKRVRLSRDGVEIDDTSVGFKCGIPNPSNQQD